MKIRLAIATLLAAATISNAAWSEELRIGIKTETSSIDPHWQTLIVNIQIDRHFFDHLIEVGEPHGAQARSRHGVEGDRRNNLGVQAARGREVA